MKKWKWEAEVCELEEFGLEEIVEKLGADCYEVDLRSQFPLVTLKSEDPKLLLEVVEDKFCLSAAFDEDEWKKIEENPVVMFREIEE